MGNVEAHDFAPVRADERNVLNLGRKVSPKQYVRHLNGQPHEACLTELPWNIRDSVCLYEKMTVAFNAVTEIPVELPLRLPHLSCLHLDHNQIAALPEYTTAFFPTYRPLLESFGLFFHLKEIHLQHNKLSTLPESFVHLVKLEKVDLSYNELRSLPDDIGKMESLKKLNVIHNKLVELPVILGSPSCLITVLLAQQNRMLKPAQSICEEGSQSLLQCLRKMHSCLKPEVNKPSPVNAFPRCCSNRSESGVANPHSAQIQYMQEQTNTLHTTNRIKAPLLPPPDASSHSPFVLQDKIIGLIYGAAIGDAMGVSCQWMSDDEVLFHYGTEDEDLEYDKIVQDEHRVLWRQGDWTSNFDQFMLVLESLVAWGGVVDELEFARRLKDWAGHGFPDLGDSVGVVTSPVVQKVISHPSFLEDPHTAASLVLQDNRPSCISSPLPHSNSNGDHGGGGGGGVSIHSPSSSPPPSQTSTPPSSPLPTNHFTTTTTTGHIGSSSSSSSNTGKGHNSHRRLHRLSSNSSSLSSLSVCSHVEVAQRLMDTATPSSWSCCGFGEDGSALIRSAILGMSNHVEVAQRLMDTATPSSCCGFGEDSSALIRSAILGVANFHEPHEVEGNTVRICRTTHAHPKCLASCVVVSSLVSLLLQGNKSESPDGTNVSERLTDIFTKAARYLTDDADIEEFSSLMDRTDLSSFDAREWDRMRHCYKLMQVAVIALMWEGDYKSLVSGLTRMGGDSSSNACLAGAIMGCRVGYSRLPTHWLMGLRKRQAAWLSARVNHLLDIMGSP